MSRSLLLAHGGEGLNFESVLFSVTLIALGIVLFFRKTVKPVESLVIIAFGIAFGVAGLILSGGDAEGSATDHVSEGGGSEGGGFAAVVPALCDARRSVETDPDSARDLFINSAHVPLHEIVTEVEAEDREAAADLLEAKQAVESGFATEEVAPGRLQADLDRLVDATVAGLSSIDVEVEGCS